MYSGQSPSNCLTPPSSHLAQEIAKNLRSGVQNMPKAQEIPENLRSEAQIMPKAQEIAKNLRLGTRG